jgi:hypothetical protein
MKTAELKMGLLMCGSLLVALGGCAQESRPEIPPGALQVSSGGRVVAFTAPHDGKAYLNDDTDHRVVYSTDIRREQVLRFDPDSDTVRIDGNTAPEGIANPTHEHSIYYTRSPRPDGIDVSSNEPIDSADRPVTTVTVPVGTQLEVQPQPPAQK